MSLKKKNYLLEGNENENFLKADLEKELKRLQKKLRSETHKKYGRVNPFIEDITDWKERGEFLFGKGKNITVYNSCTMVGDIEVGENTWIGPYTALDGGKLGIQIGSNCSISSGVNIIGHDSVKWALSGGKMPHEYGKIVIGNNCAKEHTVSHLYNN